MSKNHLANPRVSWIDTLRTISILSIVVFHTGRMPTLFKIYVTPVFMPVFFFMSGLFVKESIRDKPFRSFIRTKAQRLLIPYLTFGIFSYILWVFFIGKIQGNAIPDNFILDFLINTLYGIGGHGWLRYNVTLWFFPCLFITEIIFFFLIRIPSRKVLGMVLFALSLFGYFYFDFFDVLFFRLPFGIDIAITAVVFYGTGYLFRSYVLDNSFKMWFSLPCVGIGALFYIVFLYVNQGSAFLIGDFGKSYLHFYMAAFSGIFFWLQISRLITPHVIFEEIGKNTLVIFPLHLLLFPFFTGTLVYIFKIPKATVDSWYFLGILYAILAIAVLIPVARGLNKYTPFLLGKNVNIRGKRKTV